MLVDLGRTLCRCSSDMVIDARFGPHQNLLFVPAADRPMIEAKLGRASLYGRNRDMPLRCLVDKLHGISTIRNISKILRDNHNGDGSGGSSRCQTDVGPKPDETIGG